MSTPTHKATEGAGRIVALCASGGFQLAEGWDSVTCPSCLSMDAGLGVGHIWTAVKCPAYRTLDGADCTCGVSGGGAS